MFSDADETTPVGTPRVNSRLLNVGQLSKSLKIHERRIRAAEREFHRAPRKFAGDDFTFISKELIFKMNINWEGGGEGRSRATVNLRWHAGPLTVRRRSLYRVCVNYANE